MNAKTVYFLKPIGMSGPIKVGCSVTPENRLRSIDIWSPFPLEIIATAPGSFNDERAVHWHCRETRLHGEWFSPSPKLRKVIAFVRKTGNLPPLEAAPYGKTGKRRGNNPSRNPELSLVKTRLSRRIGKAEQHAYGWFWRLDVERPPHVKAIIEAWQGALSPPARGTDLRAIEQYISELLERPVCTKTWREQAEERSKASAILSDATGEGPAGRDLSPIAS